MTGYPEGVTRRQHIAHDMEAGRFPEQSSIDTFLAERAAKPKEKELTFNDLWCRWQDTLRVMPSDPGHPLIRDSLDLEIKRRNEAEAREALDDYVRGMREAVR